MKKNKITEIITSKVGVAVITGVVCLGIGGAIGGVDTTGAKEVNNTISVDDLKSQLEDSNTKIEELEKENGTLQSKVEEAQPWFDMQEEERLAEAERVAQEKATREAEEQRKLTEGNTVYEDDKVKINFSKVTRDGVEFLVENKTDVNITIQADSVAINGLSNNDISMSDDVSPQSRGKVLARCSMEEVDTKNIKTISGQLRIIDFNKSFNSYDAQFVNVTVE